MENNRINKRFIKLRAWFLTLLTPAFASTSIAALFVWSHLARIGQTGLFFDSISFSSLFSYLMVFASVSMLLFCIVLFMPSLLTGLFISNYQGESSLRNELTENNIKIVLLTSLLSTLIFFGYFFLIHHAGKEEAQNVSLQLGTIWLCSFVLSLWFNGPITYRQISAAGKWKKIKKILSMHVLQPMLFSLTACIYIFPLELFLRTLEFPDGTNEMWQALSVIALSIFLIIFSLIPGVVFLRLRTRTSLLNQVTVTGGIMAGILFIIFTFVHMVPALILTMFLKTSGIMDLTPHIYGVPTASYPAEYFRDSAWQGVRSSDEKYYLLKAVKIYSLGDIRLICPLNIIQSYKDSLQYQLLDTDYDDSVRGKLQDAVSQCRRVKSQELLTLEKLPQVETKK
ncbi:MULTISPECIES: hypothetical protein [Lelliottia]|uniref:Uncharacterized protein n=1 Tax=Lelliottia aquatilis TaxID=2080838 RepID=A0ABX5A0C3_9ENTR|nr:MULTISPECIES: hypothetical protein [Lelliottia]POZ17762.1 hypothetical protein C3708_18035 [Lelliottia sp. 7254-16]POZ21316.1 hypothetical protein C3712_16160 [Lelliottia aquatilis]POZ23242.1 hypothetical protein C3711_16905 [Lelliottia aquatilis]POZ31479.1 hypothetical protein C3710_17360 [Lelliottia aquatilis]POZ37171.1 hypothetical protein C3709_16755 [Lelliottia aquatilis]